MSAFAVSAFWRAAAAGVIVPVKVRPKSRRPELQGIATSTDGPRLRIDVAEAVEDGRATRAACEKTFAIAGDPAALIARLAGL